MGIERFRKALQNDPNSPVALNNLACLLATTTDPALRDGSEAVRLAEKACTLTRYQNSSVLSTLAAAYAEVGKFDEAVATAEKACALAQQQGQTNLIDGNRQMLEFFKQRRPFRQADNN
jgi:Flp pilus assembly protein TadD